MELTLLDSTFKKVGVIDVFGSVIWTDTFYSAGDFELTTKPDQAVLSLLAASSYVTIQESEHVMMIDWYDIDTDVEFGYSLIVKGISLEYVLERRIVWEPTHLDGNFQTEVARLIDENAINPTDSNRDLPLSFVSSTNPVITALTVDEQYFGETLYEVISTLCANKDIGFKVTLTTSGTFEFELYPGVDRSYGQSTEDFVVFSPEFDNLLNSHYSTSTRGLKNSTLVAGEKGVGNIRRSLEVPTSSQPTGLNRREIFTDASSVSRNLPDDTVLSDAEYDAVLEYRGLEELDYNSTVETFDGDADTQGQYKFGVDFFMGDILQIANEFGSEAASRVVEVVYSQDPAGYKVYPTFSTYQY